MWSFNNHDKTTFTCIYTGNDFLNQYYSKYVLDSISRILSEQYSTTDNKKLFLATLSWYMYMYRIETVLI